VDVFVHDIFKAAQGVRLMGRRPKVWIPSEFYHIVSRGNRREPLFHSPDDFKTFLHILQQTHEKIPFELTSYCLMTNHYHMQMRSEEVPISRVMSLINKRYADYFNNKYDLTGHVFEKRYFNKIIMGPIGTLEVSRYIHLNPIRANIAERPEEYPWSSYKYYKDIQLKAPAFLNRQNLIRSFYWMPFEEE
jgi:putative transposase